MASRLPAWASSTSLCSSSSSTAVAGSEATDTCRTLERACAYRRVRAYTAAVVADLHQAESVRGSGLPTLRSIARLKDLGHLRDREPARPDVGERPDDDPHHVPEERVA